MRAIILLITCSCLLAGCTTNQILRPTARAAEDTVCNYADAAIYTQKDHPCRQYSIERHAGYDLGIVEFDDQGWFYNRDQMTQLMQSLEQTAEKQDVLLFVFVHGWKHNADFCDENLCCFREVLQQMSQLEQQYHQAYGRGRGELARRVVGVYVGWRGLSLRGPELMRNLSFYSRKAAATRVALGSSRELLGRLHEFQQRVNGRKNGKRATRLITIGHSFGGLVVYTAVAQELIKNGIQKLGSPQPKMVRPVGDLVVLVNPAFEATRYEAVYQLAKLPGRRFAPNQDPVLIVATSEADQATKTAFPLGRSLGTLTQTYAQGEGENGFTPEEERLANLNTPGHVARYATHRLEYPANTPAPPPTGPSGPQGCGCPYGGDIQTLMRGVNLGQEYQDWVAGFQAERKPGWQRCYEGELCLKHQSLHPDNPYWVVSVDKRVIGGHNEFFTKPFLSFIRRTYDEALFSAARQSAAKQDDEP